MGYLLAILCFIIVKNLSFSHKEFMVNNMHDNLRMKIRNNF